jgi:hypothetical protein
MSDNARKANNKLRPDGYIYIIKLKGFDIYKIGVSNNPKRRIKDLDSANPFGVDVICLEKFKNVYNFEECIHDSFEPNLLRKEWYKILPEDMKTLIADIKEYSSQGIYLIRR